MRERERERYEGRKMTTEENKGAEKREEEQKLQTSVMLEKLMKNYNVFMENCQKHTQ